MPLRRLASTLVTLTIPLVMADAGPRCGGSSPRREPPNEDASHLDVDAPSFDGLRVVTIAGRRA